MRHLFISDLHLDPCRKKSGEFFLRFLKDTVTCDDYLYILGDLFETYLGDDDDSDFILSIKLALRHLDNPVFIMPGNRDFLIGNTFAKDTGATLLPDEYVVDIFGVNTLLMHGDTLCSKDKKYLRFRKIVRNPFIQRCFALLPLFLRKKLAQHARTKSKQHTKHAQSSIMDVCDDAVRAVMKKYGVKRLIHGHTHRPHEHTLIIDNIECQRVVLSDWHASARIIICADSAPLQLTTIS